MPLVLVSQRPRVWQNVPGGDGAAAVADHVGQPDPHAVYTTDAEAGAIADTRAGAAVSAHVGAADPHAIYTTDSEAAAFANSAVSGHVAATDPHTQYTTNARADTRIDNKIATHVALADPHTQYALDTDLSAHVANSDPHTVYALKTLVQGSYASSNASANQSVGTGASTPLAFATDVVTDSNIVKSANGVGHQWTLNRIGLYIAALTVRVNAGGTAAYTGATITATGHTAFIEAEVTAGITILMVAMPILVTSPGVVVAPSLYHERGSTQTTQAAQTAFSIARVSPI